MDALSGKISEEKNGNNCPIYTVLNYSPNCSPKHKILPVLKCTLGEHGQR